MTERLRTSERGMRITSVLVSVIVLSVLGFAVYVNSLNGKFVWDDNMLVVNNEHITSYSHLPGLFVESIRAGAGEEKGFYRPIQSLTYMFDYSSWKLNERGYHLTCVVLHILAALALYWLVGTLCRDRIVPVLTALFFVVHPVHTEAVSYISGRSDPLALLFMLLSLVLCGKQLDTRGARRLVSGVLSALCFVLALLSRESSLMLPLLLGLYLYALGRRPRLVDVAPVLCIAVVYIVLRLTVLRHLLSAPPVSTPVFSRIPGSFAALAQYARLLVWPVGLHMEYGQRLFRPSEPAVLLGAVLLVVLLLCALRWRKRNKLLFVSILWFIVALLPVSGIYPINAYMAEHWLYVPSIGFFVIIACGLGRALDRGGVARAVAVSLIAGLSIFWACLTIAQNGYWRDPVTFYSRTLKYAPDSARLYNNLGSEYRRMGRNEDAMAAYGMAMRLDPEYGQVRFNAASLYFDAGDAKSALVMYAKAVALCPDFAEAYYNMGILHEKEGRKKDAELAYLAAARLKPRFADAHYALGLFYSRTGSNEQAVVAYKNALAVRPNFAGAHYDLGVLYGKMGRKQEAIDAYERAVAVAGDHAPAHNNLGNAYSDAGRKQEAVAALERAIEADPAYVDAYVNLGLVYGGMDREQDAVALFQRAIELDPECSDAHYNLGAVYTVIGKADAAIASFQKTLTIQPGNAQAHSGLAVLYFHRKEYDRAIQHYDRAIGLGLAPNSDFLGALAPHRNMKTVPTNSE